MSRVVREVWVGLVGLLCSVGLSAAETSPFDHWMAHVFGVRVERSEEGLLRAEKLPNLPEAASAWYLCNGREGNALSQVPIDAVARGDFLWISFDLSAAWPGAQSVKRHVMIYWGDGTRYALVADEIRGSEQGFWTMRLPLPEETVPVNWEIDLKDAGHRADLLAGLEGEFRPDVALNKPVSGYAQAKSGSRMLLARLISRAEGANRYADRMSPMNIRLQNGRKWLTTEAAGKALSTKFLLLPFTQNRDELPQTILSQTSTRLDWYKRSHEYMFFPEANGDLAMLLKEKRGATLTKFGFRMDYQERERPQGELVAAYDFENWVDDTATDRVGGFDAKVERGRLVEGLQGRSVYLGYPDRPDRNAVPAGIQIPASIRERLRSGHLTISFWYKSPLGQAKGARDRWMWPIGETMRGRKYLDTGFFEVGHTHYKMDPVTKGFNAAWQERAASGDLPPGKWNHLVFTVQELDPSAFLYRYEVYVNGIIRTSRELGPMKDLRHCKTLGETPGPLKVGNVWGTLDNLMVFNYPLSEEEIMALYERQLEKEVSYYACDTMEAEDQVPSDPAGTYPEDSILNNRWVEERSFAGTANGASLIPGVNGKALQLQTGIEIPEKALWDLSQGAFTFSFYFKYSGKGTKLLNVEGGGVRLDIQNNRLHGAIDNQWEDKYLGYKEAEIAPDVWHHVVLAYDKRRMKLYLDGALLYDRPMASADGIQFAKPILLGGNCAIDEIHIYNYAIDPEKIRELAAYLTQG